MAHCFICRHRSHSLFDDLIDIPFHSVSHDLLQMPWLKSIPEFPFQSVTTCRICNGKALEIIELSQKIKALELHLKRSRQEVNRTLMSKYGPPGEYLYPMERLGRMIAQILSDCSVKIQQTDPVYPVVTLKEFDGDIQVNFDTEYEAYSPAGSPGLNEVNEGSDQDLNEGESNPDPPFFPTAKPTKPKPVRRAIDNSEKKDISVNCPHCNLTFQKPTALIIHSRFKHPDKEEAGLGPKFPKRKKVRQSIYKNEKKDLSVNCPHCELTFQKPTALIIHIRFKHRDPEQALLDLKCPHCSKRFASKRCRDNHVVNVHNKSTKFSSAVQSDCSVKIQQTDPAYPVVSLEELDGDIEANLDKKSEADSPAGSPWIPDVKEGSNQDLNEGGCDPDPPFVPTAKPKNRKPVRRAIDNNEKDISVNCPHCNLTFQKPAALIIHIRFKHRDPEQALLDLICPHCSKRFASKRSRDNHVVNVHNKSTKFSSAVQSDCSVKIQQTDPVFPVVSLREFDGEIQANMGRKSEADSPPGSPWLPEVNEGSNQELNDEESDLDPPSVTTAKPKKRKRVRRPIDNNEKKDISVNCPHCNLTFQKPTALIIHSRFKHPEKEEAGLGPKFPKRRKLRRAIDKNEKKDQSVNCPHCDLTFQRQTALIIHIRFKHRDPEQALLDLKCPHCSKRFASKRCRDNHVAAIHDKSTKFVCDICGHSFASRSRLSNHFINSHSEKTLKCSFCDLKFKTKAQVRHHEDRHSGRPSIVCEICGKAFYHLEALSRHKKSTHSTKSASCPQCGKVFQSIKHVRGHITRTHKQMWRKWVATAREKARKNAEESSKNNEEQNVTEINEENRTQINEESSQNINENIGHQANIFQWQQWKPTQC